MARIYTGGGDHGETRLWDGSRVSKRDPRIELNGALDETSSAVGLARALAPKILQPELLKIQQLLQDLTELNQYLSAALAKNYNLASSLNNLQKTLQPANFQ